MAAESMREGTGLAMKEPVTLDARGEAPEQYPSWEE